MRVALALARRGLGTVWPNPAVGCVIATSVGEVVGRGWTQPGGRPHAETEALARAGGRARGATAYVSLEPCSHTGKTPPCADALVAAGIARAVVAKTDPDPRVSGRGIARLREAGLRVDEGICEQEAVELNAGFFLRVGAGRPLITLKAATTLDGRIATHSGDSQWITGEVARAWAHGLRASHDAVMVGIGTAIADDPDLTCRLPGLAARSPVRIVVDGRLRLPLTSAVVRTARETPTWLVTRTGGDSARVEAYAQAGVEIVEVESDTADQPPMGRILRRLGALGLTRVMVEGGSHLAAALLGTGLIDRLAWFRSGGFIGGDGTPVAQPYGADKLADIRHFRRIAMRRAGDDVLETYARRE